MTLKQLDKELDKLNSISDKLDYLKNFHLKIKRTKTSHWGNKIIAPLSIYELAKKMRKEHFPELDKNVEFSFWFLKYNAEVYLNNNLLNSEYQRKIKSNRKEEFIKNEFKKLNDEVSRANQMELASEISSSVRYRGSIDRNSSSNSKLYLFDKKYYYIEVLRMQEGNYYMHHITEHPFTTPKSPEVRVYAYHVLYKKCLQSLPSPKSKKSSNKDYQKHNWFEIGLLFAKGEMDVLIEKFESNATKIAKHLYKDKHEGYRPYISESINDTIQSDKNIFGSQKKINQLIKYCDQNNIKMTNRFEELRKP